jgi:hypothetical protein
MAQEPSVGNGQPGNAPEPGGEGGILVAIDGRSDPAGAAAAVAEGLRRRFPGRPASVLVAAQRGPEAVLVGPGEVPAHTGPLLAPSAAGGAIPGSQSPLGALLREADRTGAAAAALVAAEAHDDSVDWLGTLIAPVLEGGFEFVSPAYRRRRGEGTLNTGIVYPLTRAVYGRRLRQPLGGEAALSLPLARRLLQDPDWRRDPAAAGSDAWLVAKVLGGGVRTCQAWLGAWPRPDAPPEDPSQTLARALGLVFREMERSPDRWQRIQGSQAVPSFGAAAPMEETAHRVRVDRMAEAFRLGQRELERVWGLVLPAATLLSLRRLAAPGARPGLEDGLWARIVYDFAVGHYARTLERHQLLLSMTPLYLGWAAGFLEETQDLPPEAVEGRVESLCSVFEREKRYLISRWRWPDAF